MPRDAAYEAMMLKLLEDRIKEKLRINQPHQTEEQVKREAERRIAYQESIIRQEAAAAQQQQQQTAQQQQQTAAQQQQTAAQQQQTAAQQKQGYGGVFTSSFSGGHGRKHKSPRRKNKTRKSRKARRLYKSKRRRS